MAWVIYRYGLKGYFVLSMIDAFSYHGSMRAGPSGRATPNLFVEGPSGWL